MKIKKNDKVRILSGKDKGKEAVVEKVFANEGKVLVKGINIAKLHIKPGKLSKEGGIISREMPLDISNVNVVCKGCNKPTKVGFKEVDGKKYRVCKRCGNTL